jgi:hypothetical protein
VQFFQQIDRIGMDLTLRLAPRRKAAKLAYPGAIENYFGHYRTSGIPGAKKEHVVWLSMGVVTHFASSEAEL